MESRSILESVLAAVPLNPPWTVPEFSVWMEEFSGKSVRLSPWRNPTLAEGGACGLLWITSTELVVKFDGRRSLRHQRQQIFHEFAHVLCDHEPDGHYRIGASGLTEGMDPASIEAVMHRDCFDAGSEAEAELVGTKLAMLSQGDSEDDNGRFHRAATFVELLRR